MIFRSLSPNHVNFLRDILKDLWLLLMLSAFLPSGAEEIDINIPLVRDFQKIGEGPEKLYVYSAYFDEFRGSDRGSIRILGGVKTVFPRPLYCKFYNKDGQHFSTVEAEVKSISENFEMEYSASFITCRVMDFYTLPSFVSLVESARYPQNLTNILRVKYPEERKREEKIKFSVCVQPTYSYDRPLQFAEWMEFHKLMGVEKFTFYNVSIGEETSCLMQTYGDEIEILPWSSSYKPEEEIRMHSQFIGAQDCLYRNRGVAEYMIYVDLDEMIVPRMGSNYSQFFDFLERELRHRHKVNHDIASYNFRNGFFFEGWEDDVELHKLKIHGDSRADTILRQLQITKKTRRARETEPHDIRSKFVVVPEKAIELGNHAVFEAAGNAIRIAVPEELAYSHHYRICLEDLCETRNTIVERSAQRFSEQVARLVADRLYSKAKHCRILVDEDEEADEVDLPVQDNTFNSELSQSYKKPDWSLNNMLNYFPGHGHAWKQNSHPLFGGNNFETLDSQIDYSKWMTTVANDEDNSKQLGPRPPANNDVSGTETPDDDISFEEWLAIVANNTNGSQSGHLPSANNAVSGTETPDDDEISFEEWLAIVANNTNNLKSQEASQDIHPTVPSSSESLGSSQNVSSPENKFPSVPSSISDEHSVGSSQNVSSPESKFPSVPSSISDEHSAQKPKEELFI